MIIIITITINTTTTCHRTFRDTLVWNNRFNINNKNHKKINVLYKKNYKSCSKPDSFFSEA